MSKELLYAEKELAIQPLGFQVSGPRTPLCIESFADLGLEWAPRERTETRLNPDTMDGLKGLDGIYVKTPRDFLLTAPPLALNG